MRSWRNRAFFPISCCSQSGEEEEKKGRNDPLGEKREKKGRNDPPGERKDTSMVKNAKEDG